MGIISNLISNTTTRILSKSVPSGYPLSIKMTPQDAPMDFSELEKVYKADPIVFNSINKAVQMIMSAGYEIQADSETTKEYFVNFLNEIGNIGESLTFDEILESVFKYQMIYGNAYIELVFNKNKDRIVDLALFDPKRLDYAKDSQNKILLDEFGRPVGYAFKVENATPNMGDKPPEKYKNQISLDYNQIFVSRDRVCHFKLYTVGDRFYGIGLIEPAYISILRKMKIEEAQTNSIYSRGTYPVIAYVGDEHHEATPQDIDAVLKNLVNLQHNRYMAFQHWVKVQPLEVKQSDIVETTLEYLRLNEAASLGMPLAFATGSGENTNKATLYTQSRFLEFTLNDIVKRTLSTLRKYMFKRISFYNKVRGNAWIKWGDIGAEEINDKAQRLINYIKTGVLKPEEIKDFAIRSEGL